jgi:hypothetical protein
MPKISALTAATAPDADDLLYIVEDGSSRKATIEQVVKTATNATGSAPIYACRAWVNFNGTGTVAIRASGNVSSITDNGVGDYTINFTTPLSDANFAISCAAGSGSGGALVIPTAYTVNSVRIKLFNLEGVARNDEFVNVAVFR